MIQPFTHAKTLLEKVALDDALPLEAMALSSMAVRGIFIWGL